MKQDTKDTHIYFPVAVFRAIKKVAADNRRTISAEIVIAVESHIANSRVKKDKPQ